jgi:anti-sigma factor RsiW
MKITCKQASRLISAGLDRELSVADRTALRLHLALCDTCNKLKAQFEFLRRALSTLASDRDDRSA